MTKDIRYRFSEYRRLKKELEPFESFLRKRSSAILDEINAAMKTDLMFDSFETPHWGDEATYVINAVSDVGDGHFSQHFAVPVSFLEYDENEREKLRKAVAKWSEAINERNEAERRREQTEKCRRAIDVFKRVERQSKVYEEGRRAKYSPSKVAAQYVARFKDERGRAGMLPGDGNPLAVGEVTMLGELVAAKRPGWRELKAIMDVGFKNVWFCGNTPFDEKVAFERWDGSNVTITLPLHSLHFDRTTPPDKDGRCYFIEGIESYRKQAQKAEEWLRKEKERVAAEKAAKGAKRKAKGVSKAKTKKGK